MKRTDKLLIISVLSALAAPASFAAFDTLAVFGDANGTTPPPSFTGNGTGTTTITAGGADFWGTSDIGGALPYDSTGTYTTTWDFTATVHHVGTTEPAPEWGRDGILARAEAGGAVAGAPEANDPTIMSFRKSNGQIRGGVRPTRGVDYGEFGAGFNGPSVATNGYYLGLARNGSTMHVSAAMNLGTQAAPVIGRWVQVGTNAPATFAAGTEVIVGLGHQSHYQTGGGVSTGGVNIGTFDSWNYTGSFDASKFGPAAGAATWNVGGAMAVNPANGAVTGRAFVQVGGVATGEAVAWTVRAVDPTSLAPAFGFQNAVQRPVAADVNDIVPAANFRRTAALTGLTADIYLTPPNINPGSRAGVFGVINAPSLPNGTAIIPNVNWTGGGDSDANYNGLTGPASFGVAVQGVDPASGAAGAFSGNQEGYGVHMQGQIYIDSDANRQGQNNNVVLWRDGIDDYTYLNIDGQVLLDDNTWTGYNGLDNGGGHVTAMDVSDPKFNDGEWVSFEMVMWEGGGGDNGVLYSDMYDGDGDFNGMIPMVPSDVVTLRGSNQIGDAGTDGSFGFLPAGQWDVTLTVANTGTSATFTQSLTVVPEPTAPILLGLSAFGLIMRRRRR